MLNSIQKPKLVLKEGYGFRLGSGDSPIWHTNWTGLGTLDLFVPFIDIHDIHLSTKNIIQNGTWQINRLYTILPTHVIDQILSLPPCTNAMVSDCLVWKGHTNGIYTTNQGYKWLLQRRNTTPVTDQNLSWNWIWKSPTSEKIKFFLWMACHHSLPTLAMFHRWGMSTVSTCPCCQHPDEYIFHCLRDYSLSARLWRYLGFNDTGFYNETNVHNWLQHGISQEELYLFISIVWWLWCARNSDVIEKTDFPFPNLQYRTRNFATLVSLCGQDDPTSHSVPRWVSWHASREGAIVLNVDGSSVGNPGPSGFGGLLRHSDGFWSKGFSGHAGISDNLHVELMALLHSLHLS